MAHPSTMASAFDLRSLNMATVSPPNRPCFGTTFDQEFGAAIQPKSNQTAQHGNQAAALLVGSDRDAQEVLDPGFAEVPHQHALLAKLREELRAAALRMAREDEVCVRRQDLETERGEVAHQYL